MIVRKSKNQYRETDYFYFKDEKDALYFVLRWS